MKYSGNFGLERETLRVDNNGALSKTPHPFGLDEQITRDFCENQVELITPVCKSINEALDALKQLDERAGTTLSGLGESLWLYSNPPHIESENDIPIAVFEGALSHKSDYRLALQMRYGKRLMLLSGVHFNFSFSDEFLDEASGGKTDRAFKDALYLRLYKQLMTHSFLLVLLTAQSAYYDKSFERDGGSGVILSRYSSVRNSERGYFNPFVPVLDHTDIAAFCESVEAYINKGMLFSASELYLPVRMKPRGENSLAALKDGGVDHIELRMFDLNPKAPLGIDGRDLSFAHLLMIYLVTLPDFEFTPELQKAAIADHKSSALRERDPALVTRAERILDEMTAYFSGRDDALETIQFERNKLKMSDGERFENYYRR